MAQVEEILKEKRAEREIKRKFMDEQWEEPRKQQLQLRQSLVKFNTLVKENVEKRERAEQKIKEEHERQEKCRREVRGSIKGIDAGSREARDLNFSRLLKIKKKIIRGFIYRN